MSGYPDNCQEALTGRASVSGPLFELALFTACMRR